MFSNRYIFVYATIMVIIVAFLLSLTATVLQPYQQKNLETEKMKDILESANIIVEQKADILDTYNKHVVREIIIDETGSVISEYSDGKNIIGSGRAFDINLKEELSSITKIGKGKLPLYVIKNLKEEILYVIPLHGAGLWGPIWGAIALKDDLNTVEGVTFGHKSETPGLGAEIVTSKFRDNFKDKRIFNDEGKFISIKIIKKGRPKTENDVDALTGGTVTCEAVSKMLTENLKNYVVYFNFLKTSK